MTRVLLAALLLFAASPAWAETARWTAAAANRWSAAQPWPVGANYIPAYATNQLGMWQAATFDPAAIDRELGWAERLGMTTARVFLHDLLWTEDSDGFVRRIDTFLAIAARHHIRPVLVLFDSFWDPDPALGPQHAPVPGVHNSGWVQSPGRAALDDRASRPRLRAHVEGVVGAFARDPRVLAWDLWNEPDNPGGGSYAARESAQSDIVTFDDYDWPEAFERRIAQLRLYGRPLICTEWMARGAGSTVDAILPIAHREHVGAINWGLVSGQSQTTLAWDSWDRPYVAKPPMIWFHDLLRPDGTPYREREAQLFRDLTRAPP